MKLTERSPGDINHLEEKLLKLASILKKLEDSNSENIEFGEISNNLNDIRDLKEKLVRQSPAAAFKNINKNISVYVKQINCIFDNIIERKKNDLQEVKIELRKTENQKKIINYYR
ncbi:MAG: hypothetical protein K9J16_02410 [Melioribacteraceae bacterium]|nr:hypothetical protein [Melioribacteraceae bacterium]MCF8353751.1 hypothetical protein [Melioribacteraceae bacterium]MCF8392440.1 hypothetical protein [Melioribacteraceae bacterium]MCF8418351.1 hypothetical protein [Melioribacteraceae bacterium]